MKKNQKIIISLLSSALIVGAGAIAITSRGSLLAKAQYNNPAVGTWVHYAAKAATETEFGIKEYWVGCGNHEHVFAESEVPEGALIVEAEEYDTTGFAENDDRWDKNLKPYNFDRANSATWCGAEMYNVTNSEHYTWPMNGRLNDEKFYGNAALGYKAYSGNEFQWVLPRINFKAYEHVYTHIQTRVWTTGFVVGFTEDYLTDPAAIVQSSESAEGLLEFTVNGAKVDAVLKLNGHSDITYSITDADVISGKQSIVLWAKASGTGDIYYSCAGFVCEAPTLKYTNYGSLNFVGRFNNQIQPLVSPGGLKGTLTGTPTGNYYPESLATISLIHDEVEKDSVVHNTSDLLKFDGVQFGFNEWWSRRLFDLQDSFWSDGDILVIEGTLLNADGYRFNFLRSGIQLGVTDGALSSVTIVKA